MEVATQQQVTLTQKPILLLALEGKDQDPEDMEAEIKVILIPFLYNSYLACLEFSNYYLNFL